MAVGLAGVRTPTSFLPASLGPSIEVLSSPPGYHQGGIGVMLLSDAKAQAHRKHDSAPTRGNSWATCLTTHCSHKLLLGEGLDFLTRSALGGVLAPLHCLLLQSLNGSTLSSLDQEDIWSVLSTVGETKAGLHEEPALWWLTVQERRSVQEEAEGHQGTAIKEENINLSSKDRRPSFTDSSEGP
ncbi:Kelch-Like Protein 7 [Manis pentadactyla]|nr:Kelch-Like Protein 7 [Manis pentadactyla]